MPTGIYIRNEEHKKQYLKNLTNKFKKGHPFLKGGEKGWFKKGDLHSKYWLGKKKDNSYLKPYQFKKGEHKSIETEFKKGEHRSIETEINKENRKFMVLPKRDTKIEVKIQNFLKKLGITFFTHQYIKEIEHGYQCDILIPSMNLVIECDGDYWHKYPVGNELDHIRASELISKGFKILRLWEHEIKSLNLENFNNKLGEFK